MQLNKLNSLIIYADLEHGNNFEYLAGFIPRFEEALLVLHSDGSIYYLLGNENLKLAEHAHNKGTVIHVPQFSLPNQPMYDSPKIKDLLMQAGLKKGNSVGIVGWKKFTSTAEDNSATFDVPYFIVNKIQEILGDKGSLTNEINIFLGNNGVRTVNNANELVHYSFGSQLASKAIIQTMNSIELDKTEMEIASNLELFGQPNSVVTIVAAGQRFKNANLYPTRKKLQLGETLSLTVGYKGGLQSRAGFICETEDQLPKEYAGYLDKVVKPYFTATCAWIENIHVGMNGYELYNIINSVFPKDEYGWTLNPGHLIGNDEWMSSPIYEGSKEVLKSGMMFQIDIIPSVNGYPGTSAECGIALIDEQLRKELKSDYPEFYFQCEESKNYLINELGIDVSNDVLVISNAVLYLRPFFLNKEYAMAYNK
jgi:Xaa-Pro aminopeptidase